MSDKPKVIVRSRKETYPAFPERPVNGSEVYSVFGSERVFAGWVFRLKAKDPKPYAVFGSAEPAPKFLGWFADHLEAHAALRNHAEGLRGSRTQKDKGETPVKRTALRIRKSVKAS